MAMAELDSFVVKLKLLMNAGHEASLNVVCKDRKMHVDLKAEIALSDDMESKWKPSRSPSYRRRQERRRAARSKAEEAYESTVNTEAVTKNSVSLPELSSKMIEKVANEVSPSSGIMQAADEDFQCQTCEFRSKWQTGLEVHMQYSHGDKVQADMTEKYKDTINYWKSGYLGTVYQRFLDVNDVIDAMDYSIQGKADAKNKILEARKSAFNGENWRNFPPWSR